MINLDAPIIGDAIDDDYFEKNQGVDVSFPKGPECSFGGKKVPTLVRWSLSGSVTSKILQDCLARTLDHYELFPNSGNQKPFLLLDGHGSRFEIPFLK